MCLAQFVLPMNNSSQNSISAVPEVFLLVMTKSCLPCVFSWNKVGKTREIFTDKFDFETIVEEPVSQPRINYDCVDVDDQNENVDEQTEKRYPARERHRLKHLEEYVCSVDYCYSVGNVPNCFQEAISGPDSKKWLEAMNDEMIALRENDTFEVTALPEGSSLVGGRWVYALKTDQTGGEKYKARFVAKGYSQIEGVDYHETFSPTARFTTIRMLMQLSVQENLVVHQMDVKSAYLHAPIDCEIFMEQPQGFEVNDENNQNLAWKLKKSLYAA